MAFLDSILARTRKASAKKSAPKAAEKKAKREAKREADELAELERLTNPNAPADPNTETE